MNGTFTLHALSYCPVCEGHGQVPSASGMSDVACLCTSLSDNDRVILRGRHNTLTWWQRSGENSQDIERMRSSMVHLVAGCEGRCRANASTVQRCVLGSVS